MNVERCGKGLGRGLGRGGWLALLLCACAARQRPAPMPVGQTVRVDAELTVTRLAEHAYVVTVEEPFASNALLMEVGDSGRVFVNTLYRPETARALLRWADEALGPRKRRVAINTHFHPDALGGNAAFLEAGIPVYGSDRTVQLLAERGEKMHGLMDEWLADRPALQALHHGVRYLPPDHVFPLRQGLSLSFEGEPLRVVFPGPAHSPDNVVVNFPAQGVLYGGCMVIAMPEIGNLSDADLEAWPKSLRELWSLGADFVIPGHGEGVDPGLLRNTAYVLSRQPRGE